MRLQLKPHPVFALVTCIAIPLSWGLYYCLAEPERGIHEVNRIAIAILRFGLLASTFVVAIGLALAIQLSFNRRLSVSLAIGSFISALSFAVWAVPLLAAIPWAQYVP